MSNLAHKAESELHCYTAAQIPHIWGKVESHISNALSRGSNYTLEDVYEGLCNSLMQLWVWENQVDVDAALVTTIQVKDDVKYLLFLALGGSRLQEWRVYQPIVEEWAREQGCTEMRIYGRLGWAKRFGFKIDYAKMSKQL